MWREHHLTASSWEQWGLFPASPAKVENATQGQLMLSCGKRNDHAKLQPLFSPAKEAKSVILSFQRVPRKRQECSSHSWEWKLVTRSLGFLKCLYPPSSPLSSSQGVYNESVFISPSCLCSNSMVIWEFTGLCFLFFKWRVPGKLSSFKRARLDLYPFHWSFDFVLHYPLHFWNASVFQSGLWLPQMYIISIVLKD